MTAMFAIQTLALSDEQTNVPVHCGYKDDQKREIAVGVLTMARRSKLVVYVLYTMSIFRPKRHGDIPRKCGSSQGADRALR